MKKLENELCGKSSFERTLEECAPMIKLYGAVALGGAIAMGFGAVAHGINYLIQNPEYIKASKEVIKSIFN